MRAIRPSESTAPADTAARVLSDGRIALIVDCDALAASSGATLVAA